MYDDFSGTIRCARGRDPMPVILAPDLEVAWLDADTPVPEALGLLTAYPSERIEAYPVSMLVNAVRSEGRELVAPLA